MPLNYYSGPVTAELRDWYFSPIQNVYWGRIYEDSKHRWNDGAHIHTSDVQKVEEKDDCYIVITLNSVYRLWKSHKVTPKFGEVR